MDHSAHLPESFSLAVAQMPITGDAIQNGILIRELMKEAADQGARLVQFPEGALSGYAKNPIQNWNEVNWDHVRIELESVMKLAKQLKLWVVLGSAHPLTDPCWPHNSLYVVSDEGKLITRYDKRICSYTESTRFYTPGNIAITFDVDGYKFGCLICVEINFPTLLIEYADLGIDCLLLSSYPVDKIFFTKAKAYAAIHNFWISLSIATDCKHLMRSGVIDPCGQSQDEIEVDQGVAIVELDVSSEEYEIPLRRARPWRKSALSEYNERAEVSDLRSRNRSSV